MKLRGGKMRNIKSGKESSPAHLVSTIFGVVFAIFWTVSATTTGAPKFFILFGIMFTVISIIRLFNHFTHITKGKRKINSESLDEDSRQVDILLERQGAKNPEETVYSYCHSCGEQLKKKYKRCPSCGDKM